MPVENREISGSPSGAPSPAYSFPPKIETLCQYRLSNHAGKATASGINTCHREERSSDEATYGLQKTASQDRSQ
jgi:hypothetical protein